MIRNEDLCEGLRKRCVYGIIRVLIFGRGNRFRMKKALIVVDMQVDFVTGALGTKEAQEIVPAVRQKIEQGIQEGQRIIFTKDTHGENYLDTQEGRKLPVEHCIRNTEGWEIITELLPYVKEVVEKPTFGSTKLPEFVSDADCIELIGLCTDICVISNAMVLKAYYPEKIIQIDASCCAGVTPQSHKNALEAMKMCQIEVIEKGAAVHDIVVQTFGKFQIFVDGKPVKFIRSKSEELFAFLIDRRGAGISNTEIASVLFEDKEYNRSVKNQVQTMISGMMKTLREYDIEDIIVRQWNSISVDTTKVKCDYFDFLKREKNDMMEYADEYMANYSWAEYTNGYLMQQNKRRNME